MKKLILWENSGSNVEHILFLTLFCSSVLFLLTTLQYLVKRIQFNIKNCGVQYVLWLFHFQNTKEYFFKIILNTLE